MPGWTEQNLRAAASWQAFKQGADLFRAGLVEDVRLDDGGWQGMVRSGKRPFRVKVAVKSATDFETRCPCPENQRSGAVCAHAVATGLAALAPKTVVDVRPEVVVQSGAIAWEIRFPGTWRKALGSGRLSVNLKPLLAGEPDAVDAMVTAWLKSQGVAVDRSQALVLRYGTLEEFLRSLVGHERILMEDGERIELVQGARMRLAAMERVGQMTRLVPERQMPGGTVIGDGFALVHEHGVKLFGSGVVSGRLQAGIRELAAGRPWEVPSQEFLRDANDWRDLVEIPADCWIERLRVVPAPCRVRVSMDGTARQLKATLGVIYEGVGECEVGAGELAGFPRLDGTMCRQRDGAKESEVVRQMTGFGFVRSGSDGFVWTLTGDGAVAGFLTGARRRLMREWDWEESAVVRRMAEETSSVAPRIEVRGRSEDWLSFAVEYRTDDGEVLEPGEVRRLLQGARVSTRRGKVCRLADAEAKAWESLLAGLDAKQEDGRYVVDARGGLAVEEAMRRFQGGAGEEWQGFDAPETFRGELREYQKHGAAWLQDRTARFGGAILADDMGLGKTVQTIAWVESVLAREAEGRVLVLATTSLLGNWYDEWSRFAPQRHVKILHGASRERMREEAGGGEVWLTSHATMVRDLAWYLRQEFAVLVVDEASLLRNPDTDQAKAVRKLQARRKVALTGTPVENSVRDLWSMFSWVQPGWLGSRADFQESYEEPVKSDGVERDIALARLRMRTAPFILRRTKERVAPELPSKIILNEFCEMGAAQAKLYADIAREGRKLANEAVLDGSAGRSRMAVLTTLLRLRQVCCDPTLIADDNLKQKFEKIDSIKHQRLIELLDESLQGKSKVLVFSQFRQQLLEIQKKVEGRGWECLRLDGQTSNRMDLVKKFQSEGGPPVFLISLKAGGYGLNLTAADVVVHMDPWWNPAVEEQANDRAHRIGQVKPVTVVRLLTRGTVEEAVVRMQERKRALTGVVGEAGEGDPVGWSMEDLRDLLG